MDVNQIALSAFCNSFKSYKTLEKLDIEEVDTAIRAAISAKPLLPKAMVKVPEIGGSYWVCNLSIDDYCDEYTWRDDRVDKLLFERSLCFATDAEAITVAKAMLALTRGQGAEQ